MYQHFIISLHVWIGNIISELVVKRHHASDWVFTFNLIFFYLCRRHRFIVGISIYINNNHLMNFVYNLSVNLTTEVVIFYKGLLVYFNIHIIANFYQITIFSHHILVDDPSQSKRGLNNIFYDFFFTKQRNKISGECDFSKL